MIDGIKINHPLQNFDEWKRLHNISFGVTVLDTGEIKKRVRDINGLLQTTFTYRGTFQTYQLQVKECNRKPINGDEKTDYFLTLDGSLHKNHFGGENYSRFDWAKLQEEISKLDNILQPVPELSEIINIEFGVNIPLHFDVFNFLKRCLISHKGETFNKYQPDKNGFVLGYVCNHSQYAVKIYDKGKQYNLPEPLMRFELRFVKMQPLKEYGIKTLTDLRDRDKVSKLSKLLLRAWDDVLLYDDSIKQGDPGLTLKDLELLKQGSNPRFWEQLKETNIRRFNRKREKFRNLVNQHGKKIHDLIRSRIIQEWDAIFQNGTNLPCGKTEKRYKFTIKVNGKNVPDCKNDFELSDTIKKNRVSFLHAKKRVCEPCKFSISELYYYRKYRWIPLH